MELLPKPMIMLDILQMMGSINRSSKRMGNSDRKMLQKIITNLK